MKRQRARTARPKTDAGPAAEAYRNAVAAAESGSLALAGALYTHCLDLDPAHVEAHHDLGVLAAQRGAADEAIQLFRAAIALRPRYAEAHANLCLLLGNTGHVEEAVAAGRAAVDIKPDFANAHANLGQALEARGDAAAAVEAYRTATTLNPRFGAVYVKLADVLRRQGQHANALSFADKGIALHPTLAEAFRVRGEARHDLGLMAEAEEDFAQALALEPKRAVHHVRLACSLIDRGDIDGAEVALRRALDLDPMEADAHCNLGVVLMRRGLARQAFDACHRAVTLNPNHDRAYSHLAGLLRDVGEIDAAVSMGELATHLGPRNPDAFVNLAGALRLQGRQADAIAAYRQALSIDPALHDVRIELCYYRQQACDWDGLGAEQGAALATSLAAGERIEPFIVMTSGAGAADQLSAARAWAKGFGQHMPLAPYRPRDAARATRKIRLAYLSADFHNHATAMLIAEVFERHDKARFEIFGYSIGRDDGSALRHRVVAAFDHFADLRVFSHAEAAARIRADEIDILIDLKGYTEGARAEILAHRPAPIQVAYLGFPATMGAAFIDYLIADPIVAPASHAARFDEKLVHLPRSYQPNDSRRAIGERPSRAACGLPETGFVFCCFNASYKITPAVFDVWMRLLAQTPGAVLWLLDSNDEVARNLRREAESRSVDPDRLIFGPRLPVAQHLGRLGVADLFLDTLPVAAHTTASEALWVGLPLLTCLGETFASRVAASLLHAVDLPDLVTESLGDYEALALALTHDAGRLAALRGRLEARRTTAPLFDTTRYMRGYESALLRMESLRAESLPPEAFTVWEP